MIHVIVHVILILFSILQIKGNHNHDQDKTTVCAKEMLSLVRKRIRDTVDPIPSIYDDMLSTLRSREWDDSTEELATRFPTFYSAKPAFLL